MPDGLAYLDSYPQAIIHFDGDAFFTSVEQAIHPELKGKPVVTGKERGIIACASYEAKALGISRGIMLHDAIRQCPTLAVLPSDYETYSLFSKRMFDITRRYSPMVEEHSIDEGFADLSGLRRLFRASYEEIARRIQASIQAELGITVSIGLSLSKSLAKMASKYRKPAGLTTVAGPDIHAFLEQAPLDRVSGFGPNTVHLLTKQGLKTAADFIDKPEKWAERLLGKTGLELWNELRGQPVHRVSTEEKSSFFTISKCKTFTAPSDDRDFIWAKLVRNIESALIKARRYKLRTGLLAVALRRQDLEVVGLEARLNRSTASPHEVVPIASRLFDRLFQQGVTYRSTLAFLGKLESDTSHQRELFEDNIRIERLETLRQAMDQVNDQYGKHTVSLGPSLFLDRHRRTARDDQPLRKTDLLHGETHRQRLYLPRLYLPV